MIDINKLIHDLRQPGGGMTREHDLKCLPDYFVALDSGDKTFEVRRDDRGFQKGDTLLLREWGPPQPSWVGRYTGREIRRTITYVLTGGQFGILPGYVVLGLGCRHD